MLGWPRSGRNRPVCRGLMVRVLRHRFRRYDLAQHLFCFWRMICKCSNWFPSRLACYHCARCPQPRKVHLGVPINPMGALIAATIRGSNARRALTAMTVAPVILGTAKQGIEGSAADNRPQDHAGADALIPPARYPGLRSRASFRLHVWLFSDAPNDVAARLASVGLKLPPEIETKSPF